MYLEHNLQLYVPITSPTISPIKGKKTLAAPGISFSMNTVTNDTMIALTKLGRAMLEMRYRSHNPITTSTKIQPNKPKAIPISNACAIEKTRGPSMAWMRNRSDPVIKPTRAPAIAHNDSLLKNLFKLKESRIHLNH